MINDRINKPTPISAGLSNNVPINIIGINNIARIFINNEIHPFQIKKPAVKLTILLMWLHKKL